MTKLFCSECGTNNSYSNKKPNFCCNCGHKFSNVASLIFPSKTPNPESPKEKEQTSIASADADDWFEIDKSTSFVSFKYGK